MSAGLIFWALPATWLLGEPQATPQPKIDYKTAVLPVLQRSCFTCHESKTTQQILAQSENGLGKKRAKEIGDAIGDFEMGPQFPFPDDRTPKTQLAKMERKLRHQAMPPDNQTKLKLGSPLSDVDRDLLLGWISQARNLYPE
jgi:uncharacterized membrane protein